MKNFINTERLVLSFVEQKDIQSFVKIAQNMRQEKDKNSDYYLCWWFSYGKVKSDKDLPAAIKQHLLYREKQTSTKAVTRLKITLKNGNTIGYIGFLHTPKKKISSDLSIFLDPCYEHQGYAFEAEKSLLAYYFLNYDDKIYLTIYPKNMPSYHLHIKCGAIKIDYEKKFKYDNQERDILVITQKEFIKAAFNKEFLSKEREKQFLLDYLKIYNVF